MFAIMLHDHFLFVMACLYCIAHVMQAVARVTVDATAQRLYLKV